MNNNKLLKLAVLLVFCAGLTACPISEHISDPASKVKVNPEFAKSPPIVSDFNFEILEKPTRSGENVRLVAEFDQGEVEGKFHAINSGGEKLVFRDDGKKGDEEAGDGKFSLLVEEDLGQFSRSMQARSKVFGSKRSVEISRSRVKQVVDAPDPKIFEIEQLEKGILQKLPVIVAVGGSSASIDEEKSLMVRALPVVEDPGRTFNPCTQTGTPSGVWTFWELMRQLASPNPSSIASDAATSAFILNWLNMWDNPQNVNSELVPARNAVQPKIIQPWLTASQGAGAPPGELKPEFSPFKLTAIVNRLDLRGNTGYSVSNGGEGRFVFTAIDVSTCQVLENGGAKGFNVIFEYGINKKTCQSLKAYGQEWADLSNMVLGSAAFNQALEDITLQFSQSGTNTAKPNESSLNQIRTNEVALAFPWELREFNLMASGNLDMVDVKMEPAVKYNAKVNNGDVQLMVDWINANAVDIAANDYEVPLSLPTGGGSTPFRGGKAHTQFPPTGSPPSAHHWNGTPAAGTSFILNDDARHQFSLNTCSGCHGGETQTFFTHVDPVTYGTVATLSGFLTGTAGIGGAIDSGPSGDGIMTVEDAADRPSGAATLRDFGDLDFRAQDLDNFVNTPCKGIINVLHTLAFDPVKMVH